MGPRSDNRGYGAVVAVVALAFASTSMGPRSDNRGYEALPGLDSASGVSFNGSTVR